MVTKFFIFQVILTLIPRVLSTELLPERYLKPKDFNHHPFTDVGIPASLKKALKSVSPYAILSKKRPREGREFPPQNVIIYPTPHPSVISRKYIETNEIGKYDDPYKNVAKNYAFSYIVKDQHSGDDFSHSQAHNGKATRGQYRVKLPDGRTQIVSYTADHKGYRADVQYEEDLISKPPTKVLFHSVHNVPETSTKLLEILRSRHQNYQPGFIPNQISPANNKPSAEVVYAVAAGSSNYFPSATKAAPAQYVADNNQLNLVVHSTQAPHYYQPTTAASYNQKHFVTSTVAPPYASQEYVSSTPLYPVVQPSANTVSSTYQQQQFQNYQEVSSTISPELAVIVTPRPAFHLANRKNEREQSAPLYYRLL